MNVYINGPGHMTKMAAMAINSKTPIKIFFSRTRKPMILSIQEDQMYNYDLYSQTSLLVYISDLRCAFTGPLVLLY